MNLKSTFAVFLIGCCIATPAISAPLTSAPMSSPNVIEKIWCRHGYCDGDGAGVGGLIGGLVGGAIAAGAASSAAQQDAQAANQARMSACAQRFRSYDPASGTYVSNGRRYPCP